MTGDLHPVATLLPGGMVILGPVGVALLRSSLDVATRLAARDGISIHASVTHLRAVSMEASAACGRSEVPQLDVPEQSALSSDGSGTGDRLGTADAAELLRCTERNVRDLCRRGVFATAVRHRSGWEIATAEVLDRANLRGRA